MPIGITEVLPPHLTQEAVRLFFEIVGQLHAVAANREGVLFALSASPQLADRLAVFGARYEDDEPDGSAEPDSRSLAALVGDLLAPAPLQGHPVPAWSPPDHKAASEPSPEVSRFWPQLVRPVIDAA